MSKLSFINHGFEKIGESRDLVPSISIKSAEEALEKLEEALKSISLREGSEIADKVLSYKTVKRALEQCLDYFKNSASSVTKEDHEIYYAHAYQKLSDAESLQN